MAIVRLNTKLRGVALVASAPDSRYRRFHTDISPAPEVERIGAALRVTIPARYADGSGAYAAGTVICSSYTEWQIDGRRVTDPFVHPGLRPIMRDGSDAALKDMGQWDLLVGEEIDLVSTGLNDRPFSRKVTGLIPSDDPEIVALRAELRALDDAWNASHAKENLLEDARTAMIARATVHDESGVDRMHVVPTELECLECGAVYQHPGSVETGGMSCQRCGWEP